MNSAVVEHLVHIGELAVTRRFEKEAPVLACAIPEVALDVVEQGTTPHRGRVRNGVNAVTHSLNDLAVGQRQGGGTSDPALGEVPQLGPDDDNLGVLVEKVGLNSHSLRQANVVGICPEQVLAPTFAQQRVQRSSETFVLFGNDPKARVVVIREDRLCVIGRSVVYDNDLKVGLGLSKDRIHGFFEPLVAVVDRDEHRDARNRRLSVLRVVGGVGGAHCFFACRRYSSTVPPPAA